jgi:hypothetical protein
VGAGAGALKGRCRGSRQWRADSWAYRLQQLPAGSRRRLRCCWIRGLGMVRAPSRSRSASTLRCVAITQGGVVAKEEG